MPHPWDADFKSFRSQAFVAGTVKQDKGRTKELPADLSTHELFETLIMFVIECFRTHSNVIEGIALILINH